jgi:uncharacterized protein YlxW (UPF0749 family)
MTAPPAPENFTQEMDALSLDQALLDAEVATARVIDLTQRLVEAQSELRDLRAQVEHLQGELDELRQVHHRAVTSRAFQLAQRLGSLKGLIRGAR